MNLKKIIKLFIFPFLVYMFNTIFMAVALDFYNNYSVDTLSHFLGGLSIAYSANYAFSLMEQTGWITIKKNILRGVIIVGMVMIFAVSWEFYEFLADHFLHTAMQPNLADTIKDLCMGMIGTVVFSAILIHKLDKKKYNR